MNYDSLHFLIIDNCSSIENAKEIADKWLKPYGERKFKNPNWYHIGSVAKRSSERRWRKELTACHSDFPWNIGRANRQVNKWIEGKFTPAINELVDSIDHGKVQISDLKASEMKIVTRYYEDRLEASRFRKDNDKQPFDMRKQCHEFNSGKFNEFGVTQIVNSFDGYETYLVAVYCNLEQFKY
jgi:hypothetical protein